MSSPAEYYKSLPPITKAYGTACLVFTIACQIGLLHPIHIAYVPYLTFLNFQVWRLITNFFFLGKFSINFGIRLLMIARYGVQLESGPFERRTADFLWMMLFGAFSILVLSAIPYFWSPFLGVSLVFMLLYLWSREYPNANINLYGLVNLKAFYLPWAMLCLDVIFGSPIAPDLLGIIAGHLYYFLTVLHPLSGGRYILKTPLFMYPFDSRFYVIYLKKHISFILIEIVMITYIASHIHPNSFSFGPHGRSDLSLFRAKLVSFVRNAILSVLFGAVCLYWLMFVPD